LVAMADTVYVVDDDASVCTAERRLLRSAGYQVLTFASAEDFLQSDFRQRPGCLLLDVRLPGMSGYELRERLLSTGVQMPTIFITGQDRPGMEERSMRLGASSYLRKPVDEEFLIGAIRLAMKSITNNKIDEIDKSVNTLNKLKKGERFTRLFTVTEPC
jgi:FixJ family two-component response regulator